MSATLLIYLLFGLIIMLLLSLISALVVFRRKCAHQKREQAIQIEHFEEMVKERTKNLEKIRDSISGYAVQKYEMAQELELKNLEISRQKDDLYKQARDLRDAYEEIKKLEAFRQQMTRMIAHDLKNPLNVVLNIVSNPSVGEDQKLIIRNLSIEMLNLVINMLEVSKLETSKMIISYVPFNPEYILKWMTEKYTFIFKQKSLSFTYRVSEGCMINGDPHLVQRILDNLISNSIKHTLPDGKISVIINKNDNQIWIEVTDTGTGIPENIIDEVFEENVHGARSPMSFTDSTGIGLAYCRLAIESMGGAIAVESKSGEGTIVRFSLQAHELSLTNTVPEGFYSISHDFNKLSVEDRLYLRNIIEELGQYKVFEVTSILKVLNSSAFEASETLSAWSSEVEKAVYAGDQTYFRRLLSDSEKAGETE
jgi:signal transduction histidine kinase